MNDAYFRNVWKNSISNLFFQKYFFRIIFIFFFLELILNVDKLLNICETLTIEKIENFDYFYFMKDSLKFISFGMKTENKKK